MKPKRTRIILSTLIISLILLSSACGLFPDQDSDTGEAIPPLSEDIDSLVMLAKLDLTLKTGADIEKMDAESIEEYDFADASLGVPEPGVVYAQVITPGYIIILNLEGATYEYHASGEKVVQVP